MKTRNTRVKQTILSLFKSNKTPLLMKDVYEHVHTLLPKTAYSTVYRIIKDYQLSGLLLTVDWRERGSRFEWAAKKHHHHLVCDECGSVADIDDSQLHFQSDTVEKETGFLVKKHSIELFGVCSPCQRRK